MFAAAWFSSTTTTTWDGRGRAATRAASTALLGLDGFAAGPGLVGCVLVGMVFAGGATVAGGDCWMPLPQAVSTRDAAAAPAARSRRGRAAVLSKSWPFDARALPADSLPAPHRPVT
jgi:hypothetical protein